MVGQMLTKRLIDAGYDVTIVSRKPKAGEFGWGDLASALEGSHAVVNLAGRPIACKFTEENRKAILDSRIESTTAISKALAKCSAKPTKWINASAVGYYGERGEERITESSPAGTGFMSEVCSQWEATCLEPDLAIERTVLRIGVVLSSHGGALEPLIRVTKLFLGGQAGNGQQWMSWIAVTDLARLIQYAIENETPSVINACAPAPVRNRDFMTWLRGELKRPWSPPVPAFILKIFGKVIGPDASLILTSCHAVSERLSGFEFDFPTLDKLKLSDI